MRGLLQLTTADWDSAIALVPASFSTTGPLHFLAHPSRHGFYGTEQAIRQPCTLDNWYNSTKGFHRPIAHRVRDQRGHLAEIPRVITRLRKVTALRCSHQ